jgi:hypothetical protein
MANNRNKINHPSHKYISEYTWAEIHHCLSTKTKNSLSLHTTRINQLLSRHFKNLLSVNLNHKHPYLDAFKTLTIDDANKLLPNFNGLVGVNKNQGEYQTVLDIYHVIIEAISDGWNMRNSTISHAFVSRYFNVTPSSLTSFLSYRSYHLDELIKHAKFFVSEKERLNEKNDKTALKILEDQEQQFLIKLSKTEVKRNSKSAAIHSHNLDALKPDMTHQKKPYSEELFSKESVTPSARQIIVKNTDSMREALLSMPSVCKNKHQGFIDTSNSVCLSSSHPASQAHLASPHRLFSHTEQTLSVNITGQKRTHETENNTANKRMR